MPTIDILLATYNGARYLPEQLASLEAQTFADWRLILRDDGSSDGSADLVCAWAEQMGRELLVINDGRNGLGASGNFGALLEVSDAPYFAFCDQDDVWLPEKLALMLERVQATEAQGAPETPLLVHSDLRVVDSELREIHPSFWTFAGLQMPREGRHLQGLMIQNVVTGCATLGNAALRRLGTPISPDAIMHDWWLALVAAAMGHVLAISQPTILYRQHATNTLGAVKWSPVATLIKLLAEPLNQFSQIKFLIRNSLQKTQRQARSFHESYVEILDGDARDVTRRYGLLNACSFWERKYFLFEERLWSKSMLTNVARIVFI